MDQFGIKTQMFPDPLKVDTVIFFNGKRAYYDASNEDSLPDELKTVSKLWQNCIMMIHNVETKSYHAYRG